MGGFGQGAGAAGTARRPWWLAGAALLGALLLALTLDAWLSLVLFPQWQGSGRGWLARHYSPATYAVPPQRTYIETRAAMSDATDPDFRAADFSLRLTAFLSVPLPGLYRLGVESDDDSLLFLDDRLLVDNRGQHPLTLRDKRVWLWPGRYLLDVGYIQRQGNASLRVVWAPPWGGLGSLPPRLLTPTAQVPNEGQRAAWVRHGAARAFVLRWLFLLWGAGCALAWAWRRPLLLARCFFLGGALALPLAALWLLASPGPGASAAAWATAGALAGGALWCWWRGLRPLLGPGLSLGMCGALALYFLCAYLLRPGLLALFTWLFWAWACLVGQHLLAEGRPPRTHPRWERWGPRLLPAALLAGVWACLAVLTLDRGLPVIFLDDLELYSRAPGAAWGQVLLGQLRFFGYDSYRPVLETFAKLEHMLLGDALLYYGIAVNWLVMLLTGLVFYRVCLAAWDHLEISRPQAWPVPLFFMALLFLMVTVFDHRLVYKASWADNHLLTLFALLAFACSFQLAFGQRSRKAYWAGFAVFAFLCWQTKEIGFVALLQGALAGLLSPRRKELLPRLLAVAALVTALHLGLKHWSLLGWAPPAGQEAWTERFTDLGRFTVTKLWGDVLRALGMAGLAQSSGLAAAAINYIFSLLFCLSGFMFPWELLAITAWPIPLLRGVALLVGLGIFLGANLYVYRRSGPEWFRRYAAVMALLLGSLALWGLMGLVQHRSRMLLQSYWFSMLLWATLAAALLRIWGAARALTVLVCLSLAYVGLATEGIVKYAQGLHGYRAHRFERYLREGRQGREFSVYSDPAACKALVLGARDFCLRHNPGQEKHCARLVFWEPAAGPPGQAQGQDASDNRGGGDKR